MKFKYLIMILLAVTTSVRAQSLDDHFRMAVERDPGLQAAYKNVEIAMEKAAQVAALPDPGLSFGYFILPVETRLGPQQFKMSLTQMFPWFGTLKAQKHAAAFEAEAAFSIFQDKKNHLYLRVASVYYALLEREHLIKAQSDLLNTMKNLKVQAESKLANGKGKMVNVLRIDRELKAVQSELRILELNKKPLEAAFNALLNRAPDTEVILADDLNEIQGYVSISEDELMKDHPELEALDLKIKANEFKEKAAIRMGLPRFGLGLDYVAVGDRSDIVVAGSGRDVLMPMLSVSLPLARGKYKAAVQSVRLKGEQLELQKEAAVSGLLTRKAELEFALDREIEKASLLHSQIETTSAMLKILHTAYEQDGSELEELLRVWRELLNYEKERAAALSGIRIQTAALLALSARISY